MGYVADIVYPALYGELRNYRSSRLGARGLKTLPKSEIWNNICMAPVQPMPM